MIDFLAKPQHGGNAFPQDCRNRNGEGFMSLGMTLRDYFAAKAMGDILKDWRDDFHKAGECFDLSDPENALSVAKDCYWIADAMLEARK